MYTFYFWKPDQYMCSVLATSQYDVISTKIYFFIIEYWKKKLKSKAKSSILANKNEILRE